MTVNIVENTLEIPDDVNLVLNRDEVTVTGLNGTIKRDFSHAKINLDYNEKTLRLWVENPRKKQAALVNTIRSHINNMIIGVTKGFTYRLKIVFIHFPMTIRQEGKTLYINNFIGEQTIRKVKIKGDVTINVEGDDIIVKGIDIEDVAQTAANIQQATKIKNKDLRKFLDGIYVYQKE